MEFKSTLLAAAMVSLLAGSACASEAPAANSVALDKAIFGGGGATKEALPFVSTILGDNMVLQRGKPDDIRESQAIVAASVPHSCLAVSIDTGDANSLHPGNKKPVGERLALCALARYYGTRVADSGPTVASVSRLPHSIRIRFADADSGLVAKGGELQGFSIAGQDRNWHWADARIRGSTVIVSSPEVPRPTQVRYDWQSDPAATLFNGAGLPAGPFRTDKWPLVTQDERPY